MGSFSEQRNWHVCIPLCFLSFYIYKVVVSCCGNFCTIWSCVLSPVREFCHLNAVTSAAPCSASPNNIPVLLIFNNSLLRFVTSQFRWVSTAFLRKYQMSQTHELSCQLQFGHMAFFALLLASIKILDSILLFIAKLHFLMFVLNEKCCMGPLKRSNCSPSYCCFSMLHRSDIERGSSYVGPIYLLTKWPLQNVDILVLCRVMTMTQFAVEAIC